MNACSRFAVRFLDFAVAIGFLPRREHGRFALGKIGFHREIGLRKIDRIFVVDGHVVAPAVAFAQPKMLRA